MTKKSKESKLNSTKPKSTPISISIPNNNKIQNKQNKQKSSIKGKEKAIEVEIPIVSNKPSYTKKRIQKKVVIVKSSDEEEEEESQEQELNSNNRENSNSPSPSSGSSDNDDDNIIKTEANPEQIDLMEWWNPKILPKTSSIRTANQLKSLEFGTYKVALHETVSNQLDLSKTLIKWEAVRKLRFREEQRKLLGNQPEEAEIEQEEEEEVQVEQERPITSTHSLNNEVQSNSKYPIDPTLEPSTSKLKSTLRNNNNPYSFNPSQSPTIQDQLPPLDFPSSLRLSQISRWPIPISQLDATTSNSSANLSLQESILVLTNKSLREEKESLNIRPRKRYRIKLRSAYDSSAPLSKLGKQLIEQEEKEEKKNGKGRMSSVISDSSTAGDDAFISRTLLDRGNDLNERFGSDDDRYNMSESRSEQSESEDEEEMNQTKPNDNDSDSDSDSFSSNCSTSSSLSSSISDEDYSDPKSFSSKALLKSTTILDQLLINLANRIPKTSWPPLDFWEAKSRFESGEDVTQREKALGWEDVVEVAGGLRIGGGLPRHILEALTTKMEEIYGPPTRPLVPVKLPGKRKLDSESGSGSPATKKSKKNAVVKATTRRSRSRSNSANVDRFSLPPSPSTSTRYPIRRNSRSLSVLEPPEEQEEEEEEVSDLPIIPEAGPSQLNFSRQRAVVGPFSSIVQ